MTIQNNQKKIVSGYAQVNSARLFYKITGRGEPIIILHGGPGLSHDYLYPQLVALLGNGYHLFFYDQRASGQSTGEAHPERIMMTTFVEDLEAMRRFFGMEQPNLAGHSFGGLLAMFYAIRYPTHVKSLILIDSEAASSELRTPYQKKMIESRLTEQDNRELDAIEASESFQRHDPDAYAAFFKILSQAYFYDRAMVDQLHQGFDASSVRRFDSTNELIRQDLGEYDIHDRLTAITCPTLIIQGDSSVFSVAGAEAIQRCIPSAHLMVLENCGHFPFIEKPNEFAQAIRTFL